MKNDETSAQRPSILDRAIAYVNPQAALRREQARVALDFISARRFDGASKSSRFEQWKRPGTSANAALVGALGPLRNASRDLSRNNPWAVNATRVIVNNTVGAGIIGQVAIWGDTEKRQEQRRKKLANRFWDWAHTTQIDADGRNDLAGIEALAMQTIVESGEVLLRRRYRRANSGLAVPIQIQVLEPDFLDDSKDGPLSGGGEIINGIEYSAKGAVVAYWLLETHPGDTAGKFNASFKSFRVPASEIIHAFDPKRAGQGRGYPWCAPVIRRLKDYDDYEDAHLVRQKISACFAVLVKDMQAPTGATGLEKAGPAEAQKEYLQPGIIEHLPPGKDVAFASPPGVQNYGEYALNNLLGIAAGYGITYESMTGNYGNVNFSSGRMGWLEMGRNITRWQTQIMRGQILERIASWFFGACTIMGEDSTDAYINWHFPKREMIDPTKEVPATIKAIRGGLTTLRRVHASQGMDTEEVLKEIKETNEAMDKDSIILDSDPRKVNMSGGLNEPQGDPEPARNGGA